MTEVTIDGVTLDRITAMGLRDIRRQCEETLKERAPMIEKAHHRADVVRACQVIAAVDEVLIYLGLDA
jgi:hypothetical protein